MNVRRRGEAEASPHGIVLSKNVMVPMRDGVRLAFDIYRPAREGDFVEGGFPTIMLHTPYDKTDKRYTEIADYFVPKGYNVVLIDLRDRYCSEASGVYYHAATPHTGRDGYDICEWIAAQPWSNGRIGTVGSSYAAITQVRTALESPPHLTAIWPDVVPTNSFQNQCREGGAMQQHMFWALFIHAQDAQDIADDWSKQQDVWNDLRDLRQLFRATPWKRGQTSLRHVPPLEDSLLDYYTRGTYDEYWDRVEHNYTRFWDQHADIPVTMSTGWYDPFPTADTEYFSAMTERNSPRRCGSSSARGATSACAATATFCHQVDFGPDSVWGVKRYFEEQLEFFDRHLPDDAPGQPPDEAPVRIFVMGGGSGRMTPEGKLDHGGRWREEWEWPLARRVETAYYLHAEGAPVDGVAGCRGGSPALHLRSRAPGADARRPLLLDRRAAGRGRGDGTGMGAIPQSRAATARPPHARPGRPERGARVLRLGGPLPAAVRPARRARLPDRAADRGRRGDRAP